MASAARAGERMRKNASSVIVQRMAGSPGRERQDYRSDYSRRNGANHQDQSITRRLAKRQPFLHVRLFSPQPGRAEKPGAMHDGANHHLVPMDGVVDDVIADGEIADTSSIGTDRPQIGEL